MILPVKAVSKSGDLTLTPRILTVSIDIHRLGLFFSCAWHLLSETVCLNSVELLSFLIKFHLSFKAEMLLFLL